MYLYTSNRLEQLIQALGLLIQQQPLPPLEPETIVVQSQGMARWLSLNLAQQLGVWANAQYPFPRAMSWQAFRACLPELPETSLYEPSILHWTILRLLPDYLGHPAFVDLQQYFIHDDNGLKHTQLAQRIATSFDQYIIYRPEMIQNWEEGKSEDWQAVLWRAIHDDYASQETQISHRAAVHQAFLTALQSQQTLTQLPQRIHIFGVSALPPFYLDIFSALSLHCEVHVWLMNPCQEYWGDIVSDTDIANINLKQERKHGQNLTAEEQYFTTGNSLLASMGKMGRDFIDLLNEYLPEELPLFAEPGMDSLLNCLQSDILHLREAGQSVPQHKVRADDPSLQIHSCHSALREIEVLHDQLLAMFERDSDLQPGDVLIMMPDIESYAPLIEAVFATTPEEKRRIPYSVADRSLRQESRIIDTFLELLKLPQSRLTLAQVMSLLEVEAVQKRFDLSPANLDKLQVWLDNAYVRWGIDASSRAELDLPAFAENTWKFGLERLLLGYALPNQDQLYQGILPLDAVEGQDSAILSQLLDFTEALFTSTQALKTERTPNEWVEMLQNLLTQFFLVDLDSQNELQRIRDALNQFANDTQMARFDKSLSPAVILDWLSQALEHNEHPTGFITGKVTFCAMLPMRSIPFKVIGLLGMNDSDYPRSHRAPGFDLMAKQPRRGDRSRRHDDRYLFLETLLSARDTLYISYQGQSIRDNSEQPPSVLVSELLNYVEQACGSLILEHIITQHPLQAFSPQYFNAESKLFSYAKEYTAASQQLLNERSPLAPFIKQTLSEPEASWQHVSAQQLVRFLQNASRYLLQQRLRIYPEQQSTQLDEQEPLEFVGLDKYQLDTHLLEKALSGEDLQNYYEVVKASGQLPPDPIGSIRYENLCTDISSFAEQVRPLLAEPLPPLDVDIKLGHLNISASFSHLHPQGLLFYRPAKIKAKDLLNAWVHHLLLNAEPKTSELDKARKLYTTQILGIDQSLQFTPIKNPRMLLRALLKLYLQGLTEPLPFFPETSFAYAQKLWQGKGKDAALKAAKAIWIGNDYNLGESDESHYRLCFKQGLELDKRFQGIAKIVFMPLLQCLNTSPKPSS